MAGNTILVVDDEQRMRKLVRDFLTKQNFSCIRGGRRRRSRRCFYGE